MARAWICASDGTWLLFYTGSTYPGPTPNGTAVPGPERAQAQSSQRIGVAWSKTPEGPYQRTGSPILEPRAGKWDDRMTTNPTVMLMADGKILLMYKASNPLYPATQSQVCLGVAIATDWRGPYERASDDPIMPCPEHTFLYEDPTVWHNSRTGWFHAIFKHFDPYEGLHAISKDGIHWNLTSPSLAYTTEHLWDDGRVRAQQRQERAQILLDPQDSSPLGIYYATDTGLDGEPLFWNMYQPTR